MKEEGGILIFISNKSINSFVLPFAAHGAVPGAIASGGDAPPLALVFLVCVILEFLGLDW